MEQMQKHEGPIYEKYQARRKAAAQDRKHKGEDRSGKEGT